MNDIRGQAFECLYDRDSRLQISGIHFTNCSFESCGFSITNDPALRSRASGLCFSKCTVGGSIIWGGVLEDIVVDGLKTRGLLQCWATVFRHVVLKGKIGRIMVSRSACPSASGFAPVHIQDAFDRANCVFYQCVDWALDIKDGEFEECEIQGVPSRLIRRDHQTQVVVKREKALLGAWRELDLSGTHWATSLDFLLAREDDDVVLVAGKRNKNFRRLQDGLELLRKAGVAEWD